jgi:hypothetical protein
MFGRTPGTRGLLYHLLLCLPIEHFLRGFSQKLYTCITLCMRILATYYKGDQIKDDKKGWGMWRAGGNEKCIQNFGWKT